MKKFVIEDFRFEIEFFICLISQGFLCPVCHRKFQDTSSLESHYLQAHTEPESPTTATATTYYETNGNRRHEDFEVEHRLSNKQETILIVGFDSRNFLETTIHYF